MGLLAILLVAALILVNAVYVAAEFAAVSVRRSRLRQLADDGNLLATWLLPLRGQPGGPRSLHRRLPDRHHALEPGARGVRAGDVRRLAGAVAGRPRAACETLAAQSTAAVVGAAGADRRAGDPRRAGPEVAGAPVPDARRRSTPSRRWWRRCGSTGPFIAWLNGSGLFLLRADRRADAGAPAHPLARRNRAADRREPRRRAAGARRAPAAAARAQAEPAAGQAADGAAHADVRARHRHAAATR